MRRRRTWQRRRWGEKEDKGMLAARRRRRACWQWRRQNGVAAEAVAKRWRRRRGVCPECPTAAGVDAAVDVITGWDDTPGVWGDNHGMLMSGNAMDRRP